MAIPAISFSQFLRRVLMPEKYGARPPEPNTYNSGVVAYASSPKPLIPPIKYPTLSPPPTRVPSPLGQMPPSNPPAGAGLSPSSGAAFAPFLGYAIAGLALVYETVTVLKEYRDEQQIAYSKERFPGLRNANGEPLCQIGPLYDVAVNRYGMAKGRRPNGNSDVVLGDDVVKPTYIHVPKVEGGDAPPDIADPERQLKIEIKVPLANDVIVAIDNDKRELSAAEHKKKDKFDRSQLGIDFTPPPREEVASPLKPEAPQFGIRYPMEPIQAKPILKWVGGKRWLMDQYGYLLPRRFNNYHEGFLGGAAVYFDLWNRRRLPAGSSPTLSDANSDLINTYRVIQSDVEPLIEELGSGRYVYDKTVYHSIRALRPTDPVERAARFIFLNKTCFNGEYRVNKSGGFNTPFGRYSNPTINDAAALRAAHVAFRGAIFVVADFESILDIARPGDFVYLDPPYVPVSQTANFTGYTPGSFRDIEQLRVMQVYQELDRRGVKIMLSNSETPLAREMFEGYKIVQVFSRRSINRNPSGRGPTPEVVVINY